MPNKTGTIHLEGDAVWCAAVANLLQTQLGVSLLILDSAPPSSAGVSRMEGQVTFNIDDTIFMGMARRLPAFAQVVLRHVAEGCQLEQDLQGKHATLTDSTSQPVLHKNAADMLTRIMMLLEFERYIEREPQRLGPRLWDGPPTLIRFHITDLGRAVAEHLVIE